MSSPKARRCGASPCACGLRLHVNGSQDIDYFSYAAPDDPRLKRFVIRLIERMTGQPYLRWLYEDYRRHPPANESFWDAAVKRLELTVAYDKAKLAAWPKTGPLVCVTRTPFCR